MEEGMSVRIICYRLGHVPRYGRIHLSVTERDLFLLSNDFGQSEDRLNKQKREETKRLHTLLY
jgi:hypothetical protein